MARAIWNGVVLAETSRPVLLEGNVYFPPEDVRHEYLARTRAWTVCPWKGLALVLHGAGWRAGEQERGLVLPAPPARWPARSGTMWRSGTGSRWTSGRWHRLTQHPKRGRCPGLKQPWGRSDVPAGG